ncbi:MAG TPA: GTPase HflX, partial [Opitutales bacterium]|nr:GTPase HflX [Opitutales bacterium]
LGCTKIVIDHEIAPAQQRHWEAFSKMEVIDREEVILDIFQSRAYTKEAVLQVELATLQYMLPRLKRAWTHLSRQRGGGALQRGEGETQLEIDQRLVHKRIARVKRELAEVVQHRSVQRKARLRIPLPTAAIVGYTNAGKSSLLNLMTGAGVLAENKLFATLDPTTRRFELPGGQTLLVTDTVGFIRRLPTHLVDAFKATLEEALVADVLIHVIDVSHPQAQAHYSTTLEVLTSLGADPKKMVTVFNKLDLLKNSTTGDEVRT